MGLPIVANSDELKPAFTRNFQNFSNLSPSLLVCPPSWTPFRSHSKGEERERSITMKVILKIKKMTKAAALAITYSLLCFS